MSVVIDNLVKKKRGRKAVYESAAARQLAYRRRKVEKVSFTVLIDLVLKEQLDVFMRFRDETYSEVTNRAFRNFLRKR